MIFHIKKEEILALVYHQINNNFYLTNEEEKEVCDAFEYTLERCEYNFVRSTNKYYTRAAKDSLEAFFNPFHSVQWMTFLYYLANTIYHNGSTTNICDKLYFLNKIMNGLDVFYAISLPKHFGAEHPVGSVMGRAEYGEGFYFYQGCTVGGTKDKNGNVLYPKIGEGVRMYSNSSILGKCIVGDNVLLGAGCLIKNQDIPANSIVFGQSPNLIIKHTH